MPATAEQAAAFASLFQANQRSYGQWDPKTKEMRTEKSAYTEASIERHLSGEMGLGLVPILDDGTCIFGVIDIDCHKPEDPRIDLDALDVRIRSNNLPLIVCRSKSGGAHCYVFCRDPVPAVEVIKALKRWATIIGYPKAEIFPKQASLPVHNDGRPLGSWINLPYFNVDDTVRFAYEGGTPMTLSLFLETAANRAVLPPQLRTGKAAAPEIVYADGPPCIESMHRDGVAGPFRNIALYNATVFFKKMAPEHFTDAGKEFNATVFDTPLPDNEATKCIRSASRRDYGYKCNEEPAVSLCDKAACRLRKFGIGRHTQDLPKFSDLIKYDTDPVMWEISIGGVPIKLPTNQLMNYNLFRQVVAEAVDNIPPKMKEDEWHGIVNGLMKTVKKVEVPAEANTSGVIINRLYDFLGKTLSPDLTTDELGDRHDLLRGQPVLTEVVEQDGADEESPKARVVAFRGTDFINYLKRTRSEDLRGSELWFALRESGVFNRRLRIGSKSIISVWCVMVTGPTLGLPPKQFNTEF